VAKRLVLLSFFLLAASVASSCASSEHSILITARAAGTNPTVIDNVYFTVIPLMSTAAPVSSPMHNPVNRTIMQINGDEPIRIAVHLHDAVPVLVHITATTASGTTQLFATRCYTPAGTITDEVLLVPTDTTVDADGDGWPDAAHVDATCRDPGPGTTGVACDVGLCTAAEAGDCNDMAPTGTTPVDCSVIANQSMSACIHPGANAVCGDGIDQDCRPNGLPGGSLDEPCGDMDGDGVNACGPAGGVCDCNDNDPDIHPGATDVCGNGIDEDCSGEPGGMGAFCDADHDTYPSNVDCNDHDPNIHPGPLSLEHCVMMGTECLCDGVDNNCNGLTDEDASCQSPDLDGDGSDACDPGVTDCASCDCNDCDSGIHPGARSICGNTIDEDGVGGDPMCDAADTDHDGYTGGQDCMEGDPHFHLDAPENCTTAPSESCGTMSCPASVDVDMDGFAARSVGGTDCDDSSATVNPWAAEICNGMDDNCDGDADEVLDPANATGCVTDPTCMSGGRCVVHFDSNLHHCGGCRRECNPGTTLVADQCTAGACQCSTNAIGAGAACAVGSTCCGLTDGMGHAVPFPGCFDTDTSTQNCGGCGNVCDFTTADSCQGGRCVCGATGAACGAGQTCCGGACVDLATDVNHCGTCTRACGARTACNSGVCGCDDPTTHGDCNPADIGMPGGNGCETDLQTDPNFCGTCAQSCLDEHVASGTCVGGACTIGMCTAPYADCTGGAANGCETSLRQTTTCGGCGTNCNTMVANATATCSAAGTCDYTGGCTAGTSDCDGSRADGCEPFAPTHCGGSCTNCTSTILNASGATCTGGGTCDYGSCAAGTSDCNGTRADGCEPFAATHCGGSCTNCTTAVANATGATCGGGGTCDYTSCVAGTSDCNGSRADGCEPFAASHCGATCTNCTTSESGVAMAICNGAGACDYTSCSAGRSDCNGSHADGCEVASDGTHCGAACVDCSMTTLHVSTLACTAGSCDFSGGCASGFSNCDGLRPNGCETAWSTTACGSACTNCTTTTLHASGLSCTAGGSCDYGSCSAGFFDCNPSRADGCEQAENLMHCGDCTTNCTTQVVNVTTRTCTGGNCGYSGGCASGFCDADGMTSNGCEGTQSVTACGPTCGNDCTLAGGTHAVGSCSGGSCGIASCSAGWANCDGMVANGCENNSPGTAADCCGATCSGGTPNCRGTAVGGFMCGT
jgi:hypothetical protein